MLKFPYLLGTSNHDHTSSYTNKIVISSIILLLCIKFITTLYNLQVVYHAAAYKSTFHHPSRSIERRGRLRPFSACFAVCRPSPPGQRTECTLRPVKKYPQDPVIGGLAGRRTMFSYSHSANSDIVGCIWGDFAGKTFANMLVFHLLFSAVKFISIKIVSQKAGKYNRIMWSST